MGKDLAKGSWGRTGDCFWWGCLTLSWVMKGTGFARWRVYRPAHPIFPAGLGCLSWKLEMGGKRALQPPCSPGRPLSLGNFPKGLHSSGILAESYPELKALSSIACQGSGSWSSAPVTRLCLSTLYLSAFALAWGESRAARGWSCDETRGAGSEHNCQESN